MAIFSEQFAVSVGFDTKILKNRDVDVLKQRFGIFFRIISFVFALKNLGKVLAKQNWFSTLLKNTLEKAPFLLFRFLWANKENEK